MENWRTERDLQTAPDCSGNPFLPFPRREKRKEKKIGAESGEGLSGWQNGARPLRLRSGTGLRHFGRLNASEAQGPKKKKQHFSHNL